MLHDLNLIVLFHNNVDFVGAFRHNNVDFVEAFRHVTLFDDLLRLIQYSELRPKLRRNKGHTSFITLLSCAVNIPI